MFLSDIRYRYLISEIVINYSVVYYFTSYVALCTMYLATPGVPFTDQHGRRYTTLQRVGERTKVTVAVDRTALGVGPLPWVPR